MAEATTRGWVAQDAAVADRINREVRVFGYPTTRDIEILVGSVERMAAEIERLHGVIRSYQARVGEKADTSTHGLTVTWLDKHDSYGILHAPSRLVVAQGWARRSDAIATADRLDGIAPWAATAAKLQQASADVVYEVADLVSEGGGTFAVRPAAEAGGPRG